MTDDIRDKVTERVSFEADADAVEEFVIPHVPDVSLPPPGGRGGPSFFPVAVAVYVLVRLVMNMLRP